MPELPEVENVRLSLINKLKGRKIIASCYNPDRKIAGFPDTPGRAGNHGSGGAAHPDFCATGCCK